MSEQQWVRLIGGPRDGSVQKVDANQVQIIARMQRPQPMIARGLNAGLAVQATESDVTIYTRRIVSTPDGSVTHFAPESWSDFDALEQALGA